MSSPAAWFSISPSRWFSVPLPADAYWYCWGLAFTVLRNSSSVLAGNDGLTTNTFGTEPTSAIGLKSFTGSNPGVLYSDGLIACVLEIVINSV